MEPTPADYPADRSKSRAAGRSQAYIVSVGERYVAINPQAMKIACNDQDKTSHASMNASADQLKSGRWESNKT